MWESGSFSESTLLWDRVSEGVWFLLVRRRKRGADAIEIEMHKMGFLRDIHQTKTSGPGKGVTFLY